MKLTSEQLKDMGYTETVPGCFKKGERLRLSSDKYGLPEQAPPKRIRQSSKPLMNKLEQEWFDIVKLRFALAIAQCLRFKLGNGIWYKPDIIAFPSGLDSQDTRIRAYEVKGPHAFRGGFENLKVAAHQYPNIKWTLVWKDNHEWKEQVVLP